MKVFYIGQLWDGGTALERMKILNRLGNQTIPFNVSSFANNAPRLVQSIASRFNIGPVLARINRAIIKKIKNLNGITHIWVDKGVWIYPETLNYLKKSTGAKTIHYTPDSQLLHQRSRHFIAAIPLYDVLVTTKEWEMDAYKSAGGRKVILTLQGYDERFFPRYIKEPEYSAYESDVCFIGHTQKHYADRLRVASELPIKLRIWGDAWPRYAKKYHWPDSVTVGTGLWGDSYPKALACTKIGLGLLGKHIPETSTTRTFEIPSMGIFLLAERTPIHQELFEEGKEAEFFNDDEEMLDKIRFYLSNEKGRRRIALAGRARCERSGYSSFDLLKKIMADISLLND